MVAWDSRRGAGGPAILATLVVYIGTPGVLCRPPVGGCMGAAEEVAMERGGPKFDGGGTPGAI